VDRDSATVAVADQQQTMRLIRLLLQDLPPYPLEPADLIHRLEQRGSVVAVLVEPAD
jgi:hypothetical protein